MLALRVVSLDIVVSVSCLDHSLNFRDTVNLAGSDLSGSKAFLV